MRTANRVMILAALVVVLWMPTARADTGVLVVGGRATERERAVVAASFDTVIRNAGWTLPAKPPAKKDSDALLGCKDLESPWTCVPPSLGGTHILVVGVEPGQADNGVPMVVITGRVIVSSAKTAIGRQRFCERCADDRLAEASGDLANQLLKELALRDGRTVLQVKSTPPGAEILLDGARIGVTDASFNTFPGNHVVIIEKPGFQRETRELTVEEGKTADVAVTLQPSAATAPTKPAPHRPSRLVPALVIGLGVTALVGGVVLQATASGPAEGEDQPSRLYSAPGLGLAIGGAVAIGIGVLLWRRASREPRSSGPAVTLVEQGGVIGWSGGF